MVNVYKIFSHMEHQRVDQRKAEYDICGQLGDESDPQLHRHWGNV